MTFAAQKQLRHVFAVISGATPESGNPEYWDGDIRWATPEDISSLNGYRLRDTRRKITRAGYESCGTTMAPPGSIVLSKRAPIGQVAILAEEACSNQGCFLLTPRNDTDTRFFYYWLSMRTEYLQVLGRGSTFMELSTDELKSLSVPYPSLQQQRAIADYLDRETARLDALVAAKERVLGLLAEKRRALVTRAVTRGLDPRAPLRDSGIPWLGEIPAHWELKLAKWLFWERDQRSMSGEEVLLSLRMERGLVPHNDVSVKQTQPEDLVGYKKVSTGEIVVNRMRAASGLVAIAPQDGLVSPDYAVFRVSPAANAEYYTHLFKTELMQAVFRSESTGLGTGSSGFLRLYSESFLSLWLPYPPVREQTVILAHMEDELAKLGAIGEATERTVKLLRERRAALIAAAVTGQIDVESAA